MSEMIAHGYDVFLEIGPHPVLASSIRETLHDSGRAGTVLASLTRQQPERSALLDSLGALHVAGYPIDWSRLHPGGGRFVRLPRYPWQRERHWCESIESREDRKGSGAHPFLDRPLRTPLPAWEVELSPALFPFLVDHRVEGTPVFPGAGYVEACIATALEVEGRPAGPVVVEDLSFRKALVLGQGDSVRLYVGFEQEERLVSIQGRIHGKDEPWVLHATGHVREHRGMAATPAIVSVEELRNGCPALHDPQFLYQKLRAIGLDYGAMFQAIKGLWLGRAEVIAEIALPRNLEMEIDRYHLHPVLLDASFQSLIAAALGKEADRQALGGNLYLPVQIRRVTFFRAAGSRVWCHAQVCEMNAHHLIGDIRLFDNSGQLVAEIRGFQCQAWNSRHRSNAEQLTDLLYDIHWQRLPAPGPDSAGFPAPDWVPSRDSARFDCVIFVDRGGTGAALATELRRREHDPIVVVPGSVRLELGAPQVSNRPLSPARHGLAARAAWRSDVMPIDHLFMGPGYRRCPRVAGTLG